MYLALARRLCLTLPEVEEQEAWGSPTFRVKGKMFAMYLNNHHGDGHIALWLKAPPGVQAMLVEAAPEKFFIPQYQGPFGWIGVHLDRNREDEIASHIRQAYRMVAPKKLQALLA
ncbi:MAG: MmcQ/YjbR family DNA-binding protein [Acidobacteria bacterium]|nr:MmcQ/YjbR family DNA-binding protein [Acidobacteriota bacterium]MBI3426441.1 MmcQ/YjbR family DNA-binding protein [Acidobacteriota bacterium]